MFLSSSCGLVKEGRALSAVDLVTAWTRRDSLRSELIARMSEYDAVLTFASTGPAPLASEGTGDPDLRDIVDADRRARL